jgi:hypothetical protein
MKFDLKGSDGISESFKKRLNHFLQKGKLTHSRVMEGEELMEFVEERLPEDMEGIDILKRKNAPIGWKRGSSGRIREWERFFDRIRSANMTREELDVSIGYLPDRQEYFLVVQGQWKAPIQEGQKYKAEIIGPCESQEQFQKVIAGIDWK